MPKDKNIRESNFRNAQNEIARVIQYLEDVKKLYFKPMAMTEEVHTTDKAIGYLNKVVQRLTKRIKLSENLNADE